MSLVEVIFKEVGSEDVLKAQREVSKKLADLKKLAATPIETKFARDRIGGGFEKLERSVKEAREQLAQFNAETGKVSASTRKAEQSLEHLGITYDKVKSKMKSPLGSQMGVGQFAAPKIPSGPMMGPATSGQHTQGVMKQINDLQKLASLPIQTTAFRQFAGEAFTNSITPAVMQAREQVKLFNREMGEGREKAKAFGTQLGFVGRLIVAMGVRKLVHDIIELTDAYTSLQNKLKVVTDSQIGLKIATEDIIRISNETRMSIEDTTTLFTRVTQSVKSLGKTQTEVTKFTELMNKAIAVSGATSMEAKNAIVQLAQGMSLGTVKGQDLKSVMSFLPYVSELIATKLGTTVGRLKDFGAEGKITTDAIMGAIVDQADQINEKFNRTVPTIRQLFDVLKNKYIVALGEATTITATMSKALSFLIDNFDLVVRAVIGLGATVTAVWTTQAMISFVGFLASNPFTLIIGGIAAATAAIVTFGDKIKLPGDNLLTMEDAAKGLFDTIKNDVTSTANQIDEIATAFNNLWSSAAGKGQGTDWTMEVAYGIDLLRFMVNPDLWVSGPLSSFLSEDNPLYQAIDKDMNATQHKILEMRKEKKAANDVAQTAKINDELARWRHQMSEANKAGAAVPPTAGKKGKKESGSTFEELIAEATFRESVADEDSLSRRIELKLHASLEKLKPSIKKWKHDIQKELAAANKEFNQEIRNNIDDWDPDEDGTGPMDGLDKLEEKNNAAKDKFEARKKKILAENEAYEKQAEALKKIITDELTRLDIEKLKKKIGEEAKKAHDEYVAKQKEELDRQLEIKAAKLETLRIQREQAAADATAFRQGIAEGLDPTIAINRQIGDLERFKAMMKDQPKWVELADYKINELRASMTAAGQAMLMFGQSMNGIFGPGGTLTRGLADSIVNAKNLTSAMRDLLDTIGKQALSAMIQMPLNAAMGGLMNSLMPAGPGIGPSMMGGAATSNPFSALTPDAGLPFRYDGVLTPYDNGESIYMPGRKAGGYTGDMPVDKIAGVHHGKEFVVNAEATRKYRPALEAMNSGAGMGGPKIVINNNAPVEVEARQNSVGEIEVLIHKAIREKAGDVVAAQIRDSNSNVSKAMNRYTTGERRRP